MGGWRCKQVHGGSSESWKDASEILASLLVYVHKLQTGERTCLQSLGQSQLLTQCLSLPSQKA